MHPLVELLRPGNCAMAGAAVLLGYAVGGGEAELSRLTLGFLAAFLICGAGNTINDFYDYPIDLRQKPERVLPRGALSLTAARRYAHLLFLSGLAASLPLGALPLLLAGFNSGLLYLYAAKLKRAWGLVKNLTVSYLTASPLLYGGAIAGDAYATLPLVLLALLANTAREIAKDIEDMHGDAQSCNTLPLRIGVKKSAALAALCMLTAVLLSPLPYLLGILGVLYLPVVAAADALFLLSIRVLLAGDASRSSKLMKAGMLAALLSFLAGLTGR